MAYNNRNKNLDDAQNGQKSRRSRVKSWTTIYFVSFWVWL